MPDRKLVLAMIREDHMAQTEAQTRAFTTAGLNLIAQALSI